MPSIRVPFSLAGGATNPNVLQGSAFEFASGVQRTQVAITQELIGAGVGTAVATVQFGPTVALEDAAVASESTVGAGPRIPDNVVVDDIAAPGDRLRVAIRNTDAANGVDGVVFLRTELV